MSNAEEATLPKAPKGVPTLECKIEGPVTHVRQESANGVMALTTLDTREFLEALSESWKPYKEEKSPFLNIIGVDYQAVKYWQMTASGSIVVVNEASPRSFDLVVNNLGWLAPSIEYPYEKYKDDYQPLIDCGRLKIFPQSGSLRAKLNMPYTILVNRLIPKTDKKVKSYYINMSYICWADQATKDLNSKVYVFPLPNIYTSPFTSSQKDGFAKICWGDAIRGSDMSIESSPLLFERFYNSKFNTDLTGHNWFLKGLPHLIRGPEFDPKEPISKRLNASYIQGAVEASAAAYAAGQGAFMGWSETTLGMVVKTMVGSKVDE